MYQWALLFLMAWCFVQLVGCRNTYPCYGEHLGINDHGSTICAEAPTSKEEVATIQTVVGAYFAELYPSALSPAYAYHGLDIQFLNTDLALHCYDADAEGLNRCQKLLGGRTRHFQKDTAVKWYPCLSQTAVVHELLHALQLWSMGMGPETNRYGCVLHHRTPGLFNVGEANASRDYKQSIEYKAAEELRDILPSCEDYR